MSRPVHIVGTFTTRTRPVESVQVDALCPKCKEGILHYVPEGEPTPTTPPAYEHQCDKCQQRFYVPGGTYPRIEHRPRGEDFKQ